MGTMESQITSLTIAYLTVYSDADQRKHQSSASLAFVWGIHRGPVNSPHKWTVTRKMFPFDDVIMTGALGCLWLPFLIDTNKILLYHRLLIHIWIKSWWHFPLTSPEHFSTIFQNICVKFELIHNHWWYEYEHILYYISISTGTSLLFGPTVVYF